MFSLDSLIQAITEKECCDSRKGQACKRLTDDKEHLAKLNEGKFAIKSMFKTSSGKQKQQMVLLERIAQTERDIENWDTIKRFLIVYLAEIAIPEFRGSKVIKYINAMASFSKEELNNA